MVILHLIWFVIFFVCFFFFSFTPFVWMRSLPRSSRKHLLCLPPRPLPGAAMIPLWPVLPVFCPVWCERIVRLSCGVVQTWAESNSRHDTEKSIACSNLIDNKNKRKKTQNMQLGATYPDPHNKGSHRRLGGVLPRPPIASLSSRSVTHDFTPEQSTYGIRLYHGF